MGRLSTKMARARKTRLFSSFRGRLGKMVLFSPMYRFAPLCPYISLTIDGEIRRSVRERYRGSCGLTVTCT